MKKLSDEFNAYIGKEINFNYQKTIVKDPNTQTDVEYDCFTIIENDIILNEIIELATKKGLKPLFLFSDNKPDVDQDTIQIRITFSKNDKIASALKKSKNIISGKIISLSLG